MTKIHRPIRKQFNAAGSTRPAVSSQPAYSANTYTARATAINPSSIVSAFSVPPIQEAIIPIAMAAFPGFDVEIQPPEGVTWPEAKMAEAKKGLAAIHKITKPIENIRWSFFDTLGFRHAIFNYSLKTEGNWTIPEVFSRLPPESFGKAPSGAYDNNAWWKDPLLQGITVNRKDNTKHYYQAQSQYGEPVEIPEEELLHIFWELPGNQSILAAILPTIEFWHFARKCLGLSAQRQGVPNAVASYDLEAAKWLSENTDSSIVNGLPDGIKTLMDEIVKSQSIGTAFNLPPGGKLEYPATSGLTPAQELDQYVERKLILHIIPTQVLDTLGAAISKSSAPALDLFILLTNGWREVNASPLEHFDERLLVEYNGFEDGTRVFYNWWPIIQADKVAEHNMIIQDVMNGIAGINEARKKAGYEELDEAGISALIDEHNRLGGGMI